MTQKDKELLLRDLCARLPYGVNVKTTGDNESYTLLSINSNKSIALIGLDFDGVYATSKIKIDDVKPYLRPMSSMTEEEWKELNCIGYIVPLYDGCFGVDMRAYLKNNQPHYRRFSEFSTIEDWLNAHHLTIVI